MKLFRQLLANKLVKGRRGWVSGGVERGKNTLFSMKYQFLEPEMVLIALY